MDWKSRCRSCGQLNYEAVVPPKASAPNDPASVAIMQKLGYRNEPESNPVWANKCGRCGAIGERGRVNLPMPLTELRYGKAFNGESHEIEQMDMASLRYRVKFIQSFDQCVEDMRSDLIYRLKEGLFDPINEEDEEPELEAA